MNNDFIVLDTSADSNTKTRIKSIVFLNSIRQIYELKNNQYNWNLEIHFKDGKLDYYFNTYEDVINQIKNLNKNNTNEEHDE